jgi:hypothetical protein
MTTLLIGTFVVGGVHTLLWLPRALQLRRELQAEEAAEQARELSRGDDETEISSPEEEH